MKTVFIVVSLFLCILNSNCSLDDSSVINRGHFLARNQLKTESQFAMNEFFSGVFEENNLPDPIFIAPCYDEYVSEATVYFLEDVFNTFSGYNIFKMKRFYKKGEEFIDNSPNRNALECVLRSPETAILHAYYSLEITILKQPFISLSTFLISIDNLGCAKRNGKIILIVNADKDWEDWPTILFEKNSLFIQSVYYFNNYW